MKQNLLKIINHYGIDDIEIVNIMKFKIKRQLERIELEEKED